MLADGEIRTFFVAPEDFGFSRASPEEIAGGSVEENARMLRAVLAAEDEGARRDVVLLNAGAAIFAAEEADSLEEGVEMAKDALESGQALRKLDEFVKFNAQ